MNRIKITKLDVANDPLYPTMTMENYVQGMDNGDISIPINYWVIGTLINPIVEGEGIAMFREIRNGEQVTGLFTTSVVKTITGLSDDRQWIETQNSKYLIEPVEE